MRKCPDHICIPGFLSLKAMPVTEGGERYVYMEASNEARDYENEKVLCKALAESADYFLRYGNIDLDHLTVLGPIRGIPNYSAFEIGRPVEVKVEPPQTFVKARIYQGDGPAAEHANAFWSSLTDINPPQRWYPSVGGAPEAKEAAVDEQGNVVTHVTKVRWVNVGLSKTPVNLAVPEIASVPLGAFAKAFGAHGLDLRKALEANTAYTTDVAQLRGGAALGAQSLDGAIHSYWDFRERAAGALLKMGKPSVERLHRYAVHELGIPDDEAAEWIERLFADLKRNLKRSRS